MNLTGKVAWITGGARMGLAVANALSQAGCSIALSYRRSQAAARQAQRDLEAQGVPSAIFRCDLGRASDIATTARAIAKRLGGLDILVNLSSIYETGAWEAHMELNATTAHTLTDVVVRWMKQEGRIIHIADWTSASRRPRYKEFAEYYVSKAAIQAIVEAKALALAPRILVNAIAPGPMLPPKGMKRAEIHKVIAATPLKRWGGAEEIAKAVRFLCETDFVTGETIRVDGGRHLY